MKPEGGAAGEAVMGLMRYGDYMTTFEPDVRGAASPRLAANDEVVVIGYDGVVSTAGITWAPGAGPIPATIGEIAVLGSDGVI